MKYFIQRIVPTLISILIVLLASANEGKNLYTKFCSPCHTIGMGRLVGPDLVDISDKRSEDWLISFIISSQTLINSGDSDAQKIYKEYNNLLMPDQPLNDEQVKLVLTYINDFEFDSNAISAVTIDYLANVTQKNVTEGLLLFSGEKSFENGGASCISCHNVKDDRVFSNGTLAKDLTQSYAIMGGMGVSAIIKNPPFPAMTSAYSSAPLTDDEVYNLTAYLNDVNQDQLYRYSSDFGISFFILGSSLFLTMVVLTYILYFNRKRKPVNHAIYDRQTQVLN